MTKYTAVQLQQFIDAIKEDGINLTPWEETFVESVEGQLARTGRLSEAQVEHLDRIYAEKTP